MRFKSFKVIGITILIAVLFIAYQVYREKSRPFQALPERIENFEALDVDGGKTDFKTHKGKVTLIVLSASWCPACIAELPTLEKLYREFAGDGFKVLMISEDDNVRIASRFKKKYSMPWTMLHWNYDLINMLGNPRVIPVSYLIDEDGKIDFVKTGLIDEKRMRRAIKSLVR